MATLPADSAPGSSLPVFDLSACDEAAAAVLGAASAASSRAPSGSDDDQRSRDSAPEAPSESCSSLSTQSGARSPSQGSETRGSVLSEASAPALGVWREFVCPATGFAYYLDASGDSRWAERDDVVAAVDPNGYAYLYNIFTGESCWDAAASLAAAPVSFRFHKFGTVEPVSATESAATNGPEAVAAVALDAGAAAAAGATAYAGYNPFLGPSTTATAVAPSARGRESGVASVAPTAAAFDSDYASLPDMPSSPLSAPPLGPAALLYDSPHRKSSRSKRRHRAATGVSDTATPLREPVASTHALPPSWHRQAPLSAPAGAWGFSPSASSPASPSTRSPASVLSPTIRRSLSFQEAYSSSPVRESSSSSSAAAAAAFGTPSHRTSGGRSSATPRPAPRPARSDREESRSSEVDPAIWRDVLFNNVRDWEDLPRPRSTDSAMRSSARTPSRSSNSSARMPREYRLDDDVVEEAEEEIDRSEYRGRHGGRAETARAGNAASKSRRERLEDEERGDDLFDDESDLDADEWSLVESLRESGSSLLALLGWSGSRTGAEGERGAAERRRGAGGARRAGPTLPTHREPGTPPPAPSSRAAAQRELDGAALTPRPTGRRPTGDSPLGVDASAEIDAVAAVHSPHVRFQVGESPDAVIGLSFTERVAWVRGALSALGSSVSTQAATLTAVLAERGGPALDAFIRLAHRQTARIVALAESGAEPAGEGSLTGLALPRHVQDATRAQADAAHLDSQLDGVAMRAPLATTSP